MADRLSFASALVTLLDEHVRELVRRELATRTGDTSGVYDTDHLPPLVRTKRTFHAKCRSGAIPAARKEGRKWVVSRADWHRATDTTPRASPHQRATVAPASNSPDVDAIIEAAGYRLTSTRRNARTG